MSYDRAELEAIREANRKALALLTGEPEGWILPLISEKKVTDIVIDFVEMTRRLRKFKARPIRDEDYSLGDERRHAGGWCGCYLCAVEGTDVVDEGESGA